jgi:hypothetical protein
LAAGTYSHDETGEKDRKSDEEIVWEWRSLRELKICIKPLSEKIGNNGRDKKDKEIECQMAETERSGM